MGLKEPGKLEEGFMSTLEAHCKGAARAALLQNEVCRTFKESFLADEETLQKDISSRERPQRKQCV